jgi:hypothetical protein
MFNRNENKGVIRNVRLLKDAVDEIVIIDSSDPEKYKELKNSFKLFNNINIKLFRVLPLGHVEPLFHYGINKTSSEYVLRLDADEEPSKKLVKRIKERKLLYDVYDIPVEDKKKLIGYKLMVLFSKKSVKEISGIIHSGIKFKEKPKNFPKDEFIINHEKPTRDRITKNYVEIESYERPMEVYLNYLKKKDKWFIGNLLSFIYNLPKPVNIYLTAVGISYARTIFDIIQHNDRPFNNIFYTICYIVKNPISQINYSIHTMKFFSNLPKEEQKLRIKIAKEIQEYGGVIKYLGLDRDYIVENLTRTFKWDMSGTEAFRKLLLYRHFHKKPAYEFPYYI